MHSPESIQAIADGLVQATSAPTKVILIGSYARGNATSESDLDFLVLQKNFADKSSEHRRLIAKVQTLATKVDLILMRESDFEWKSLVGGTLAYWAKLEGRVLNDFS
jgi:uncharacterized protein